MNKQTIEKRGNPDASQDEKLDEAELSLAPLDSFRDDEDAIDRLLRDTGFDADNALGEVDEKKDEFGSYISLSDEVDNFNKPEIVQTVDADQLAEDSATLVKEHEAVAEEESLLWFNESQNDEDAIDRLLMDTGFDNDDDIKEPEISQLVETDESEQIAGSVLEQVDDKPDVIIADNDYMDVGVVAEASTLDKFDAFSDFNDFSDFKEPEIPHLFETDELEGFAEDSVTLVEEVQPVDDELEHAVEPSLVSLNNLQNEEDAIDRLLLETGFDADHEPRDDVDAFSGFGEIKDDFVESHVIQEDDDGKDVQAIADSVDFDGDRLAGLFVNATENRSNQIDDDNDLAEIDEFAQLDKIGDIFVEHNIDDFSDESDKQEEQIQQAGPEEIAIWDIREDDFLLPDLDIIADKENPDTWIDLGIEEDKLADAFNEPDLFSNDGVLEDELEKIGLASVSNEMPAEIKPAPSSDNNASVIDDAKNAVLSQIDAEPERTDEQYKKHIKDAENKAKKATVFSYVALGFCVVTFIAAVVLAVMAYGAKTEILKLIEVVSALEQGAGEGALKNPDEDSNVSVEQLDEQSEYSSDLGENNPPEVIDEPVAEAAKAEAVSKPVNLKPKAEAAKKEVVSEAGTAKPKIGPVKTKVTSKQENLKPKADTVKSAVVSDAAVAKIVAATKPVATKKTATQKEMANKTAAKATKEKEVVVAATSWTVQLAAYKQEWYAKSQAAGFKQKGVPVEVVPGNVNNTAWYRLRVGGFKNKGEAASYAARIKKALKLTSVSVTDN